MEWPTTNGRILAYKADHQCKSSDIIQSSRLKLTKLSIGPCRHRKENSTPGIKAKPWYDALWYHIQFLPFFWGWGVCWWPIWPIPWYNRSISRHHSATKRWVNVPYTLVQPTWTSVICIGDINDGYTGGFAGRIIAAKYTSFGAGTQMFDFAALGGVCSSSGSNCFPLHNDPNTDTAIAESSTVSEPDTTLLPTVSVEETFLFSTATDTTEPPPPANTAVLEGTCSPQIDQDSHIHKHHHHLKPACCNIGGYHHHHELLFCEYDDHQHEEINDGDYEFDHGIQF